MTTNNEGAVATGAPEEKLSGDSTSHTKSPPADQALQLHAQHLAPIETLSTLPALIDRASTALAEARTAAEVLEARDMAGIAYDAAKKAARLHSVRGAHDTLIAAAHRAQADALEIEAGAKRRLADEYDAAQERGEVVGPRGGGDSTVPVRNAATAADLGLTRKEIHDAREVRNAEQADPGIVRRTLDEALAAREQPTRARVKRAVSGARPDKPLSKRKQAQADRAADRFEHAIFAISETCAPAGDLDVPELDREKELEFINDLRGVKTCLTKLIKKINGGNAKDELPEATNPLCTAWRSASEEERAEFAGLFGDDVRRYQPEADSVEDETEDDDDDEAKEATPVRRRAKTYELALGDAISAAFADLEDLANEIREALDNVPESLRETARNQTLEQTADTLEGLTAPEVDDTLATIKVVTPKGRKPRSRSDRRDDALSVISACVEALELQEGTEADSLRDDLENASSEAESCDFPGIYQ
jgi:hypothetical protein